MQVERIQNKLLYQNFDDQRRRIIHRWHSVEPNLNVQMRLWHGTGPSDPYDIYDSEEGELKTVMFSERMNDVFEDHCARS